MSLSVTVAMPDCHEDKQKRWRVSSSNVTQVCNKSDCQFWPKGVCLTQLGFDLSHDSEVWVVYYRGTLEVTNNYQWGDWGPPDIFCNVLNSVRSPNLHGWPSFLECLLSTILPAIVFLKDNHHHCFNEVPFGRLSTFEESMISGDQSTRFWTMTRACEVPKGSSDSEGSSG